MHISHQGKFLHKICYLYLHKNREWKDIYPHTFEYCYLSVDQQNIDLCNGCRLKYRHTNFPKWDIEKHMSLLLDLRRSGDHL